MDGGAAFEEWVGVKGGEGVVGDGDAEAAQDEIELEVLQPMRKRKWVKGLGGVRLRGLEVQTGRPNHVVHSQRHQRRRREHLVNQRCRHFSFYFFFFYNIKRSLERSTR